ncbi:MAG: NAD(P)/FAD-dependent oxidoreductase [Chloroflexi bacterium]|nr:NAD(P)/FAD-dependent oxidoreductase [Chloroflexota bacterium]
MSSYSALFQPGKIGTLQLKNRLIMPAMGTQLADVDGRVTQRLIDYYVARARGGAALITPQFASISPDANLRLTMAIYDDSWIGDWRQLADAVHEAGSKLCLQLMSIGMLFLYSGFDPNTCTVEVPSLMPWLKPGLPYRELTLADIDRYVNDFAAGAVRSREAGADAVELHACHGCLVGSFLSPAINRRTDQYGGSVANRTRFARRIIEEMRARLGPDFPVVIRMNASDDVQGGLAIEEAVQQALILESAGVSAISVSGGLEFWSTLSVPSYLSGYGPMVPLAEKIKRAVKVPVITAGKMTPEMAAKVIEDHKADFIAMARPLLADPELPNKLQQGRPEEVRKCIYCNNCLKSATDPNAGPMSCSVNPFVSRESKYPFKRAPAPKKVVVIGGGLAGMETAIYLSERGHRVSLFEKERQLGGQWNVACASPGKDAYGSLTDYLKRSLDRHGVQVTLGTEVTKERVLAMKPDVTVVATGALPVGLRVPGGSLPHVVQGHDVLGGKAAVKGKAAVVGGRFIGMEVAIMLKEQGRDVCLVTKAGLGEDGIKLEQFTFKSLADRVVELGVPLFLNAPVLEITSTHVVIDLNGQVYQIPADTVILSVGMRSVNGLAKDLEGLVPELYTVGDCVKPQDASTVSYQAARLASGI